MEFLAQGNEGGGAALDEVIGMSVVAVVVTAVLLWIGYLHRNAKITWLTSLAEWAGRKFKRPPWVALPMAMFITTIICALFGFIWDVSLHIGNGRDAGAAGQPRALLHPLRFVRACSSPGCTAPGAALRQARPVRACASPKTGTRRSAAS